MVIRYADYIRSAEWREKSEAAKRRAGYECAVCARRSRLQAHHRTYRRLGHELPTDLVVLCHDCHRRQHERDRQMILPFVELPEAA